MASKKSGTKAKSVGGAKRGKSEAKGTLKDLDVKKSKGVRGGMVVKMNDVTVTSVTHGGGGEGGWPTGGGDSGGILQHEGLHGTTGPK